MIFPVPTIPFTQKATILCVAKLAKKERNDIQIPTNVPIIFFILDLLQKQFHIFVGACHVCGMGLGYRSEFIPVI
jgi:hypothetical protein